MESRSRSEKQAQEKSISITSPMKAPSTREPSKSTYTRVIGTGLPKDVNAPNFAQIVDEAHPIGNRKYEFMMNQLGFYGHFFPRSKKSTGPIPVEIQPESMGVTINEVLYSVLHRLMHKEGHNQRTDITTVAQTHAKNLTNGCLFMLYTRLRSIHRSYPNEFDKFLVRPHAPDPFEVPVPYALAIQNIGLFRVSSLPEERELLPTFSKADAELTAQHLRTWSLLQYQHTVEFAKELGMRFQTVNLTVKLGTAWWLFKPVTDESNFELQCCLPEDNYTDEDAIIRALFCSASEGKPQINFVNLEQFNLDRGSFIRNPPPDIALTCFHGMNEDSPPT